MRLIDADAFVQFLKDTVIRQKYENLKIDGLLTVADVIDAVICDLDGTCLDGFKNAPTIEERKWIPCGEPPEDERNVFIAHGSKNFMTCCIGHYDHDSGLWYEDRNWFARPICDGMYWCEMPMLPETEG